MRVFVTGGTGLIGPRLIRKLRSRGDEVVLLSRRGDAWMRVGQDVQIVQGDPNQPGAWQEKLAECDACVNLAGESLFAKRWTAVFKQTMERSRIDSTRNVAEALAKSPTRADGTPKALVNGSATGYYGPHPESVTLDESATPGRDFLARLCVAWEAAAKPAEVAGVRLTYVRTGVVLDKNGGALKQLLLPFQLGLGGPVGLAANPKDWGKQIMSWIHHADEVGIILLALDHPEARGPLNGTAPNLVANKEFGHALGAALHRPSFSPTPAFALRLLLGEVADVVTKGQRVLPTKAEALGYRFQYPLIGPALVNIISEGKSASAA